MRRVGNELSPVSRIAIIVIAAALAIVMLLFFLLRPVKPLDENPTFGEPVKAADSVPPGRGASGN